MPDATDAAKTADKTANAATVKAHDAELEVTHLKQENEVLQKQIDALQKNSGNCLHILAKKHLGRVM